MIARLAFPSVSLRAVFGAAIVAGVVVLSAAPALAHVELASSAPADGAVITEPPTTISLGFSTDAVIAGDGVVLYDETGAEVPAVVEAVSGTLVEIRPSAELSPGPYLVTWTMQAGDSHPKTGSVAFTVSEPVAPAPVIGPEAGSSSESAAPANDDSAPAVFSDLAAQPSTATAEWVGRIARALGYAAVLLGLGAFIFAAFVFEGTAAEARTVGYWGRRAGAVILLTVPLEIASQSMLLGGGSLLAAISPGGIIDALGGQFGFAILLRSLGGVGLLLGTRLVTTRGTNDSLEPRAAPAPGAESASGVAVQARPTAGRTFHVTASPAAVAGAAALAASFLFDGHTAVTAPSWLVRFATMVHVIAAAAWVGGVAMLAAVFARRRRHGVDVGAARLVIPFSVVAAGAVTLVGLAGAVLAVATVEAWSDFVTTPWGRALLVKLGLVGVAAAMGAYNHFTLVPLLKQDPADHRAADVVAASVRIELGVLLGVATVTAVLVGLAS